MLQSTRCRPTQPRSPSAEGGCRKGEEAPRARAKYGLMSLPSPATVSVEEYLAAERVAESKSEYYDGVVYAMSGASLAHNQIVTNLIVALQNRLKGGKGRAYPGDLRVSTPSGHRYFYPDVTVVCGPAQTFDERNDILLNPTVVVEVLSDSTAAYDRGRKFLSYQTIPSLKEYLLVAQDEQRVETFRRQPGGWLYTQIAHPEAAVALESLGLELPLVEIYEERTS